MKTYSNEMIFNFLQFYTGVLESSYIELFREIGDEILDDGNIFSANSIWNSTASSSVNVFIPHFSQT